MQFAFFFLNDTATTEIYALSLHDALPISSYFPVAASFFAASGNSNAPGTCTTSTSLLPAPALSSASTAAARSRSVDRKSTRLNSSHGYISYAVFCLKKKKSDQSPETPYQY